MRTRLNRSAPPTQRRALSLNQVADIQHSANIEVKARAYALPFRVALAIHRSPLYPAELAQADEDGRLLEVLDVERSA
jgi:hypothetical protein